MKKKTLLTATVITEEGTYRYSVYAAPTDARSIRAQAVESYKGSYFTAEIIDIIW